MTIPRNIENAAARATVLKRQIADLDVELELRKEEIREWAMLSKQEDSGLTMLEIPTVEGTCSVVFPSVKAEFIKGIDVEEMADQMVPTLMATVVSSETKYVIAKKFVERWNQALYTKDERHVIEQFVVFKEPKARVEPAK